MAFKMNYLSRPRPVADVQDPPPSSSRHRASSSRGRGRSTRQSPTPTTSSSAIHACIYFDLVGLIMLAIWNLCSYVWTILGRPRRGSTLVIGSPQRSPEPKSLESESDNNRVSDYAQDELGASQLADAPIGSQASPAPKQRVRSRADVGSHNTVPTNPGRQRKAKKPYTPHSSSSRGWNCDHGLMVECTSIRL
jgi:hypothetical protein